jgi:hypothetical protein
VIGAAFTPKEYCSREHRKVNFATFVFREDHQKLKIFRLLNHAAP